MYAVDATLDVLSEILQDESALSVKNVPKTATDVPPNCAQQVSATAPTGQWPATAPEGAGNNSQGCNHFYLNAKARIWP